MGALVFTKNSYADPLGEFRSRVRQGSEFTPVGVDCTQQDGYCEQQKNCAQVIGCIQVNSNTTPDENQKEGQNNSSLLSQLLAGLFGVFLRTCFLHKEPLYYFINSTI